MDKQENLDGYAEELLADLLKTMDVQAIDIMRGLEDDWEDFGKIPSGRTELKISFSRREERTEDDQKGGKGMSKIKIDLAESEVGCLFRDILWIPLSPAQVEDLESLCERKAMETGSYITQGSFRTLKDLFEQAMELWREKREKVRIETKKKD